MNDPWMWTRVWGWTVGAGGQAGWEKKNLDNYNRINNNF